MQGSHQRPRLYHQIYDGVSAGTEGAKEGADRSSELRGDGALLPLLAEVGLTKRDLCREGEADLDKRPRVLLEGA